MSATVSALQGYLSAGHAKVAKAEKTESDRLKEACQGFEALFMHKMMQTMRQSIETMDSGLIKKSNGEKIFTDMLDEAMTSEASKASVGGMADMLYESMKWTVEGQEKMDATASDMMRQLGGLRKADREDKSMEHTNLKMF